MPNATPSTDPVKAQPMLNEADIGSGERTPGQLETDEIVGEVPKLPPDDEKPGHPSPEKTGAK